MSNSDPISFNKIYAFLPLEGAPTDFSDNDNTPTFVSGVDYDKKGSTVETASFTDSGACIADFPNAWAGKTHYTVAGWAKLNEVYVAPARPKGVLFGGLSVFHDGGQIEFNFVAQSGSVKMYSSARMLDSVWTHVAVTFNNADDVIQMFVNGHLDAEVDLSWLPDTAAPTPPSDYPIGGPASAASEDDILHGSLSQLYYYERTLSNNEIRTLADKGPAYEEELPISYDDILAYLPLEFNALDYSGKYNTPRTQNTHFVHGYHSYRAVASFTEMGATVTNFPNGKENLTELSTAAWVCMNSNKGIDPVHPDAPDERAFTQIAGGLRIVMNNGQPWASVWHLEVNGYAAPGVAGGNAGLEVGVWAHLAVTYSATDKKIKLYMNGEMIAYSNLTLDYMEVCQSPVIPTIGGADNSGTEYYLTQFDGYIAEVYHFARALSQEEVQTLAALPVGPTS
jgi:hypothetical protein